jgi:hypothetical protein
MRKLSILIIIFGLIGFGLFTITNKSFGQVNSKYINFGIMDSISEISRKEAIKEIKEIKRKAIFHNQSIDLILTYAEKSNYNHDTYVLLSKLIGSFGHSTKPTMEIANIAFLTHSDCDIFNEIAPLIFLNTGVHTNNIVDLAEKASESRTEDEKYRIHEEIIRYRESSKFKTLDEAFNYQKEI